MVDGVISATVPAAGVSSAGAVSAAGAEERGEAEPAGGVAAGLLAEGDASGSVPSVAVLSGENHSMPASIAAAKSAAAATVVAALRRLPGPPRGAARRERPAWAMRPVRSPGAPGSAYVAGLRASVAGYGVGVADVTGGAASGSGSGSPRQAPPANHSAVRWAVGRSSGCFASRPSR